MDMESMSTITQEKNPFHFQEMLASLDHIQLDHSVVSPMNRLPIELVAKIFTHCLPDKPASPDQHKAPLLLGQICKHWRTIALATPLLWRTISARLSSDSDIMERQVAWIELWLLRSSECPLVIDLIISRPHSHRALDAAIRHAHRWQDVSLYLTLSSLRRLAPIQGRLFELRRLRLRPDMVGEVPVEQICTFQAAPNLQEVDIFLGSAPFDLPWTQLIRARFRCHVPDCAEYMRKASNLVQCTLGNCWLDSDVRVPDRIVVSQIVSLHLEETYQSGVESIFQYVTLPALRDLSISFRGTVWPHSYYVAFLLRSRCRIERLALIGATMAYQELVSLLQSLPSIVELHILWVDTTVAEGYQPIVDDNFLRLLTCNESLDTPPVLLPKLQAIMLWGPLLFDDQSLVNMIQTRLLKPPPSVACLAYVGLYYHRQWDKGAMKRLESFRASGLELIVEKVPTNKQQLFPEWDGFQLCVSV